MRNISFTERPDGTWLITFFNNRGIKFNLEDIPPELETTIVDIISYIDSQKTPEEITAEKLLTYVSQKATDEEKLTMVDAFPVWEVGIAVGVGYESTMNGELYRVIQAHTTQSDWAPDTTPALWKKITLTTPESAPANFVQPTGAHDAYMRGEKMLYTNNHVYECLIDNTIHTPEQYAQAWKDLGEWIA